MSNEIEHEMEQPFTAGDDGQFVEMTESQVARHVSVQKQREKAARKAKWKQHPAKTFAKDIALPYVSYGAAFGAAAHGWAAYTGTPDMEKSLTVAAVALPLMKAFSFAGQKAGFAFGHVQNMIYRDRFNEIKTEPKGKGFGAGLAAAFLLSGGLYINDYGRAAADSVTGIYNGVSNVVDIFSQGMKAKQSQEQEIDIPADTKEPAVVTPAPAPSAP